MLVGEALLVVDVLSTVLMLDGLIAIKEEEVESVEDESSVEEDVDVEVVVEYVVSGHVAVTGHAAIAHAQGEHAL